MWSSTVQRMSPSVWKSFHVVEHSPLFPIPVVKKEQKKKTFKYDTVFMMYPNNRCFENTRYYIFGELPRLKRSVACMENEVDMHVVWYMVRFRAFGGWACTGCMCPKVFRKVSN